MLILTRRPVEKILMKLPGYDHPIEVIVLGVKGNQVRIGFVAPKSLKIDREEIFDRIKRDQQDEPSSAAEPNGNI